MYISIFEVHERCVLDRRRSPMPLGKEMILDAVSCYYYFDFNIWIINFILYY